MVVKVAENGGFAVEAAHNRKVARYANCCEMEGMVFVPMAVDTLGGDTSHRWWSLTNLATSSPGPSAGMRPGASVHHLRQRLGVVLLKDNTSLLGSRAPVEAPVHCPGHGATMKSDYDQAGLL